MKEADKVLLEESLRKAVEAIIHLSQEASIGPELPFEERTISWMEPDGPGTAKGVSEKYLLRSLDALRKRLGENFSLEPSILALENHVQKISSNKKTYFHAVPTASSLLKVYFHKVGQKILLNKRFIKKSCEEMQKDILSKHGEVYNIYQVSAFQAEYAFSLAKGIHFRPISRQDIADYGADRERGAATSPWLHAKDWVCEIESEVSKDDQEAFNYVNERILKDIISALALVSSGRADFHLLSKHCKSPFLQGFRIFGGYGLQTSRSGVKIELDANKIKEFKAMYKNISIARQYKGLTMPLRRLEFSAARNNTEDHLVDCVVGLERLLASDSPQLETTYRFRLRGAAVLPKSYGSPRERIDLMGKLYEIRSNIVHGNAKESQVNEYSPKAEQVLKDVIKWYLRTGIKIGKMSEVIKRIDEKLVGVGFN